MSDRFRRVELNVLAEIAAVLFVMFLFAVPVLLAIDPRPARSIA